MLPTPPNANKLSPLHIQATWGSGGPSSPRPPLPGEGSGRASSPRASSVILQQQQQQQQLQQQLQQRRGSIEALTPGIRTPLSAPVRGSNGQEIYWPKGARQKSSKSSSSSASSTAASASGLLPLPPTSGSDGLISKPPLSAGPILMSSANSANINNNNSVGVPFASTTANAAFNSSSNNNNNGSSSAKSRERGLLGGAPLQPKSSSPGIIPLPPPGTTTAGAANNNNNNRNRPILAGGYNSGNVPNLELGKGLLGTQTNFRGDIPFRNSASCPASPHASSDGTLSPAISPRLSIPRSGMPTDIPNPTRAIWDVPSDCRAVVLSSERRFGLGRDKTARDGRSSNSSSPPPMGLGSATLLSTSGNSSSSFLEHSSTSGSSNSSNSGSVGSGGMNSNIHDIMAHLDRSNKMEANGGMTSTEAQNEDGRLTLRVVCSFDDENAGVTKYKGAAEGGSGSGSNSRFVVPRGETPVVRLISSGTFDIDDGSGSLPEGRGSGGKGSSSPSGGGNSNSNSMFSNEARFAQQKEIVELERLRRHQERQHDSTAEGSRLQFQQQTPTSPNADFWQRDPLLVAVSAAAAAAAAASNSNKNNSSSETHSPHSTGSRGDFSRPKVIEEVPAAAAAPPPPPPPPPKAIDDQTILEYCYHGEWELLKTSLSLGLFDPARIAEQLPLPLALPALRGFHDVLTEMVESTAAAEQLADAEERNAELTVLDLQNKLLELESKARDRSEAVANCSMNVQQVKQELEDMIAALAANERSSHQMTRLGLVDGSVETEREIRRLQRIVKQWESLVGRHIHSLQSWDVVAIFRAAGMDAIVPYVEEEDVDGATLDIIMTTDTPQGRFLGLETLGDRLRLQFFFNDGVLISPQDAESKVGVEWDDAAVDEWLHRIGISDEGISILAEHRISMGNVLHALNVERDIPSLGLSHSDAVTLAANVQQLQSQRGDSGYDEEQEPREENIVEETDQTDSQ